MTDELKWNILINDEKKGPFTYEQILEAHKNGLINSDTMVWAPHLNQWQALQTVLPAESLRLPPPFQHVTSPALPPIPANRDNSVGFHWMPMTSFLSGLVVFIVACCQPDGKWKLETVTGVIVLAFVPIVFGIISLASGKKKSWMAITGLTLGSIVALAATGSL